jgi:hypothetical protein
MDQTPPAVISLRAIARTEASHTELKRSNKETSAARAIKALFFVSRQRYRQETALEIDCNNVLETRSATDKQRIVQRLATSCG